MSQCKQSKLITLNSNGIRFDNLNTNLIYNLVWLDPQAQILFGSYDCMILTQIYLVLKFILKIVNIGK